jgi:hypothetical protein
MRANSSNRSLGVTVIVVAVVLAISGLAAARACGVLGGSASNQRVALSADAGLVAPASSTGNKVCGSPSLRSPFSYHRKVRNFTRYRSGTLGLPTFGKPGTNFPSAKAGVILPPGTYYYQAWQLRPNTVYYLEPGLHISSILADAGDVFVGGYYKGTTALLSGKYNPNARFAIDTNTDTGNQKNVVIEYLKIQGFKPGVNSAAINMDANTGWVIKNSTIAFNVPGAGVMLGTGNVLKGNCLTLNGQYGFQSEPASLYNLNSVTGGTHDVSVLDNEISFNDTCDYEGLLTAPWVRWKNYNPVPTKYRNTHCGTVVGSGNYGAFKLWETDNVTVAGNYIHNNYGPGVWADTNNANTSITNNVITNNDAQGIIDEVSYNFSITDNYIAGNDRVGITNPGYPAAAIYISESGSDTMFGGVPGKYRNQSIISGNTLVNNPAGVFLWQNSNRACSDGSDIPCTLVKQSGKKVFTVSSCAKNLSTALINTKTFQSVDTGTPKADWYDGCMWRTENVSITRNLFVFNPAAVPNCTQKLWPYCGATGIFSQYGGPASEPGWVVATDITFFQHNVWSHNVYKGPWKFYAWNLGNNRNPVTWAAWTGRLSKGDKCTSAQERQSGACIGPFGQDAGSTFTRTP